MVTFNEWAERQWAIEVGSLKCTGPYSLDMYRLESRLLWTREDRCSNPAWLMVLRYRRFRFGVEVTEMVPQATREDSF